jgi:hypothetical protein
MNTSIELVTRRLAIGTGVVGGLAIVTGSFEAAIAQQASNPQRSRFFVAAQQAAIQRDPRCSNGVWAVLYKDNNFGGQSLVITNPQATTMPNGWDDEATSGIVGPRAVLRLFHRNNFQDTHITLLPGEEVAHFGPIRIHDGASSYKLWAVNALQPPY